MHYQTFATYEALVMLSNGPRNFVALELRSPTTYRTRRVAPSVDAGREKPAERGYLVPPRRRSRGPDARSLKSRQSCRQKPVKRAPSSFLVYRRICKERPRAQRRYSLRRVGNRSPAFLTTNVGNLRKTRVEIGRS